MNAITPFLFEGEQLVRVVVRDGEPWFVAVDVCKVLGIVNASQAVDRLDDDEVTLCQTEGSVRPANIINESGLVALILRSDKPQAKRFRKWVTAEVLPSIRRTGRYEAPDASERIDVRASTYEVTNWLRMIADCRLVHGSEAARWLWAQSPLPQPPADLVAREPPGRTGPPGQDPHGCLDHLLSWPVSGTAGGTPASGGTVAALLIGEPSAEAGRVLARHGVAARPKGWTGYFGVGRSGDALSRRFAGTPWARSWGEALRELPDARSCPTAAWLDGKSMRVVLLPVTVVATWAAKEDG